MSLADQGDTVSPDDSDRQRALGRYQHLQRRLHDVQVDLAQIPELSSDLPEAQRRRAEALASRRKDLLEQQTHLRAELDRLYPLLPMTAPQVPPPDPIAP